jgi:hypothetical protein
MTTFARLRGDALPSSSASRMARATSGAPVVVMAALAAATLGCNGERGDPLARARASIGKTANLEASIPPVCYATTKRGANVCWTCHAVGVGPNALVDADLQREYSFSDEAQHNRWQNVLAKPPAAALAEPDEAIVAYIRADNYTPLRRALARRTDYRGFVPDLDLASGFDEAGFARDASGWRALRYKPFPGSFWPTNGSSGDVFIRLPRAFRLDASGSPSLGVYRANLAILEASMAEDPSRRDGDIDREVEPVSEADAGLDLDGDGAIGRAVRVRGLPTRYAGGAREIAVRRYVYPEGTEFLHTVRYLDPDEPTLLSARMKEVRYARKVASLDAWAIGRAYEREAEEKDEGRPPVYTGSPEAGLRNSFGWQLQGFIEDEEGSLRLQTEEEHRACMGCHSGLGITVDQTFAFPRKVPGAAGFRPQDLRGMPDAPQAGHADPEALVYLRRAGRGDDYGGNEEMLARFFPGGVLDEAEVRRAAAGGDQDLAYVVVPSRARALRLDKAYRVLVLTQRFDKGRDALPAPREGIQAFVENGKTGLEAHERVYLDGRLHLDWRPRATR